MTDQSQKTAYQRLKEFEGKGCHMLIPSAISVEDIASGFALIVEPVLLRSHPREKDVYPHDSGQYDYKKDDWKEPVTGKELVRIHKQGLDRLAQAAKVDWLPAQIVRDPNVSGRMMASVEGMIRTSTGELFRVQDIAGMDLDIEMEKIIAAYSFNGTFKKENQWKVDRDYLQKKANQSKLCISGAKNRVIKQLLCLRNTYTVADLAKEFVAVRIVPRLDTSDEYTRRRLVDVQIAAMAGIYGLIPNAQPMAPQQIEMVAPVKAESCTLDDGSVIEAETETTTVYTLGKDKEPPPEAPPFALDTPQPTTAESLKLDFVNSEIPDQVKALLKLADKKNFAVMKWLGDFKTTPPATIETIGQANRDRLYGHLCGLSDKGKEAAA